MPSLLKQVDEVSSVSVSSFLRVITWDVESQSEASNYMGMAEAHYLPWPVGLLAWLVVLETIMSAPPVLPAAHTDMVLSVASHPSSAACFLSTSQASLSPRVSECA